MYYSNFLCQKQSFTYFRQLRKFSPILKFLRFVIPSRHTLNLVFKLYRMMLLSKFYNQVICDVTSYYYYQKFELKSLAEIQIIDIYSRL